jgi:O-antigen biosynthesis protein
MRIGAAGTTIRRGARWIARRLPGGRSTASRRVEARDPHASIRSVDGPVLVDMPLLRAEDDSGAPPRVTVLLPALLMARMTGGTNTAINLTSRLAGSGFGLRFVATFGEADDDFGPIRDHVERLVGRPLPGDVEFVSASGEVPLSVRQNDVFVATWWPTAHVADAARQLTRSPAFIYLIQDFEPSFYPWSTSYALAASSYEFPSRVVFNESLLRDHFRASGVGPFARPGDDRSWTWFEPAVDRTIFRRQPEGIGGRERRRLLFYARPKRPRNCFELGLRAIRIAAQAGTFDPDTWEVVSIGSDVPELELGRGLVMRPAPWMSYAEYGTYLGESDVLLSLMLSPHTSYPPLEMATAGGIVVTSTFGVKTEAALAALSPRILASAPDPAAVASALGRAAALATQPVDPEHPGAGVALPATWDESFVDVVPWLVETVRELAAGS